MKSIARANISAANTIKTEAAGLNDLTIALETTSLGDRFNDAADIIAHSSGRVIVTGMGKSGHIGRKIAATLASTGTPAFFMHPAEASHGDLGMVTPNDVVLALSWSGESAELRAIITYCGRFSVPLIGLTSQADSALSRQSTIALILPRVTEACPNQLAPTSSTTAQLAMGDALAVALIELRGFSAEDFRIFHPGGKLGSQLLVIDDIMGSDAMLPKVNIAASVREATIEMSSKRYGISAIVDDEGHLVGAFTDGDLRRSIVSGKLDDRVENHMTPNPVQLTRGILLSQALNIMNTSKILQVFVCDDRKLVGVLHIHDILRVGVV